MYSVRKTTKQHGNTNLVALAINIIVTSILIWQYGLNYLVIFCSSALLHVLIETGLATSGIRKGEVYALGRKLPRAVDILLKAMVEGPAFCVSAYFVADQVAEGNYMYSILAAIIVVGSAAFYMGWADRRNIKYLKKNDEILISRRAMNKPKAMMLLAMLNTLCLSAMFLIPEGDRSHAFSYLFSYAGLVLLFYFLNYNLGVRYVDMYDHEKKEFYKPGTGMQIAGLSYDSAYEMALLISPAYWLTYYLGFFS